jgi:hypothetical protein
MPDMQSLRTGKGDSMSLDNLRELEAMNIWMDQPFLSRGRLRTGTFHLLTLF